MARIHQYDRGCFDGHPGMQEAPGLLQWKTRIILCVKTFSTTFQFRMKFTSIKDMTGNLRVLVSLDASKSGKMGKSPTNDYPVSWVKCMAKEEFFTRTLVIIRQLGGLLIY